MPRKTKFASTWLNSNDKNGGVVKDWCRACDKDEYSAECFLCCKKFSISNMGFLQILSHADGEKHKRIVKSLQNQLVFKSKSSCSSTGQTESSQCNLKLEGIGKKSTWQPSILTDKVLKAEALIILTAIKNNHSFASIDDLANLYCNVFDDSIIVKGLKLSDKKARYILNFGLAPYFRENLYQDIGSSFFVLHFDETTTSQIKKQFDIYLSYWSESKEKVVTSYCESEFLGHAESDKVVEKILNFISSNGFQRKKLLQCSMDGPSVNICSLKVLNMNLHSDSIPKLIDIGTCCLHKMYNSFKEALGKLDFNIDSLATDIYQYFKLSAARREDYHNIQTECLLECAADHIFLRHVSSRWLTLGPVCDRIIEQFPALTEYFVEHIPKNTNVAKQVARYHRIVSSLKDPNTLIYLHFISSFVATYKPYLKLFQREDPLIHIMYSKLNELVRTLMLRFLKSDVVKTKEGFNLLKVDLECSENWLLIKKMDIGMGARQIITKSKNDIDHKQIQLSMRRCFITAVKYLLEKLPLTNPLLRDLQILHPDMQKEDNTRDAIGRLCKHLMKILETESICDKVTSEWAMYMCEDLSSLRLQYDDNRDICNYWLAVSKIKDMTGVPKFKNLFFLIKNCLSLSHGNAQPERGFSYNNAIVTKDRVSLSEMTIRSLRLCKDTIRIHNNSVNDIPVTKSLLQNVAKSHAAYASYMEQKKEEQNIKRKKEEMDAVAEEKIHENALKRRKLEEKLRDVKVKEQDLMADENAAKKMLIEASEKLNSAIVRNSMSDIKVANIMISSGNAELVKISDGLKVLRKELKELQEKTLKSAKEENVK